MNWKFIKTVIVFFIFISTNKIAIANALDSLFKKSNILSVNKRSLQHPNIPSPITLKIDTIQPTCGKYNGTISIIPSGGVPPYTFTLFSTTYNSGYFGAISGNIDYPFTIKDAAGNKIDTTIRLTNKFSKPSINYNYLTLPSCNDSNGVIKVIGSGGTPPYLYSNDFINYQSNDTFTNIKLEYKVFLVKDANGCTNEFWETFPNFNNPECFFVWSGAGLGGNLPSYMCGDKRLATIVFSWRYIQNGPPQFSLDNGGFQSSHVFDTVPVGKHVLKIINATKTDTVKYWFTVSEFCSLEITGTSIAATCKQSNGIITVAAVNGTAPYKYSIDGINWQTSNIFSGLRAGNYIVVVKDANGLISSTLIFIDDNCPKITAATTNDNCGLHNGTITATGSKGTIPYKYSIDGINFQNNNQFTGISQGQYTVTIKDANNFTDTVSAKVNGSCLNLTTTVIDAKCDKPNGQITVVGSDGTTPYKFSIDGTNFQTNNIFTGLVSKAYTVTIKDANGLTNTTNATVKNIFPSELKLGKDTILCRGQFLTLSANVPGTQVNYTWQDNSIDQTYTVTNDGKYWLTVNVDGCIISDTINVIYQSSSNNIFPTKDTTACIGNAIILDAANIGSTYLWDDNSKGRTRSVASAGNYWVQVKTNNCIVSDTINCNFIAPPKSILPKDTSFCEGQQVRLVAGDNAYTYLWNDNSKNAYLNVMQAGNYRVAITNNNCTSYDSVLVIKKPNPIILNLGKDTTLCEGNTITLNATNNNAAYMWQDNSVNNSYLVTKTGQYRVKINQYNCESRDTINIDYKFKPNFTLGEDQLICQGQPITLKPNVNTQWQLLWQDGSKNNLYVVTKPGVYTLTAKNECGSTTKEIAYTQGLCQINIPNAFTPNKDRLNDVFKVLGTEQITDFNFKIFNRYGEMIFETKNKNTGWDGTVNYQPSQAGTYIYLLQYKSSNSSAIQTLKGNFVLIR